MSVKVFIERRIKPNSLSEVLDRSMQLRTLALKQRGYVSGETLVATDRDDAYLVISTWRSMEDWKEWQTNPERVALAKEIDEFLVEPISIRTFTDLFAAGG